MLLTITATQHIFSNYNCLVHKSASSYANLVRSEKQTSVCWCLWGMQHLCLIIKLAFLLTLGSRMSLWSIIWVFQMTLPEPKSDILISKASDFCRASKNDWTASCAHCSTVPVFCTMLFCRVGTQPARSREPYLLQSKERICQSWLTALQAHLRHIVTNMVWSSCMMESPMRCGFPFEPHKNLKNTWNYFDATASNSVIATLHNNNEAKRLILQCQRTRSSYQRVRHIYDT